MGSIPGFGRSPGGGHSNPLQYSYLENPMDRGAWQAAVHRVTQSWTRLKQLSLQTRQLFRISLSFLFLCFLHLLPLIYGICHYQNEKLAREPSECAAPNYTVAHAHRVRLFATPWTVVLQAPLSRGFTRQEYKARCHSHLLNYLCSND